MGLSHKWQTKPAATAKVARVSAQKTPGVFVRSVSNSGEEVCESEKLTL
jgi:hypothetical protein